MCVPAGTRNHFALDIGVDRNDVVGALDAFIDGLERRIDLARVNGRVFVNNVAMGVYGAVVQSSAYRDHKVRTVIEMLPGLVGPGAERFDLRFAMAVRHDTAVLDLVSNNPYAIEPWPRRPRGGTSTEVCSASSPSPGRPRAGSRNGRRRRFVSTRRRRGARDRW